MLVRRFIGDRRSMEIRSVDGRVWNVVLHDRGRLLKYPRATTQQVEPGVPSTFELFLLFDAFEVFLFPALCFVAHSWDPRGAGLNAGNASAVSEPGRRISTATGR